MSRSHRRLAAARRERRGAVVALVAFMLVITLVVGAIAVDVAHVQLVNTQLRKVADAASHAGSEALARTQDEGAAIATAHAIAQLNSVMGASMELQDEDIDLGRTEYAGGGSWSFADGATPPNSVRVNTRVRPDGVPTTFGRLAGVEFIDARQKATSAHFTRDIVFVLDRSGSMAWDLSGVEWQYPTGRDYCTDPDPDSRWGAVDVAVRVFLDELENTPQVEKVGIATYATAGNVVQSKQPRVECQSLALA